MFRNEKLDLAAQRQTLICIINMTFLTFSFVDFHFIQLSNLTPNRQKNVFLIENLESKIEAID